MEKLSNIAKGYTNLIRSKLKATTKEEEKLYKLRINICNLCKFKSENNTCKKCGCYLPAKTKSLNSNCPINLW